MLPKETQTRETANNIPSIENTPAQINYQNPSKSQPMTQLQKDNVRTNQYSPYKRLVYGFILVILTAFLFVAAIYYGIINP
ncbi:hypothetical protein [Nodularia sp. LEGE 04288]|uniref:hypothetical protein n=1 Tax=Nodularia sp. LEGE 04288 TaxID=1828639 RepID=UPI001D0FC0D6|nr:hypothetical protein [Nodularia sp. LEGE 04288]MCC2693435.1 hypothetical protein [Nodularia sp. LEGE 04288]